MPITQAQIKNLSRLSALHPPADTTGIEKSLSGIISYFGILDQVDTTGVHTSKGSLLPLRADIAVPYSVAGSDIILSSPQRILANQIVIGGVMVGE
jgi:Asp-tRNA(Asn)/Glu-tRNA(Gln) amidotransferase C subunit